MYEKTLSSKNFKRILRNCNINNKLKNKIIEIWSTKREKSVRWNHENPIMFSNDSIESIYKCLDGNIWFK